MNSKSCADNCAVYKGAPQLNLAKLPQTTIAVAIVLTGVVIALLAALFWLPYVYAKVVRKDHSKSTRSLTHLAENRIQLFDGITSSMVPCSGGDPYLPQRVMGITSQTIESSGTTKARYLRLRVGMQVSFSLFRANASARLVLTWSASAHSRGDERETIKRRWSCWRCRRTRL